MKRIFIILSLISAILISQRPVIIGDINGDFSVDVLDIVGLVTIILGGTEPEINEFVAGDINFDGSLDVLDIVELVTSIIMPPDCPDNFDNCSNVPDQCCDINHESAYLQCEDCHILDYINTESPNHLEQFFPHSDCNICHMATGWQDILFQHTILDVSCNICHLADLQVANQLVNQHNTLSSNCDICHTTQTWPELDFLHEVTGFVLEGLHEGLACNSCHESSWLAVTDECSTCHQPDWEFTTEPIHSEQIFHPEDCIDCHDAYGWIPSIFEHDLPQQAPCSSCHIADFDNANILEPDHQNFTTDCQICHVSTQWNNVNFDHNSTEFPLVGSHQTANCEGCHSEGYTDIETTCENCHLDDYDLTENPDHTVQTFLSADCEDCHTAVNWTDIIFEHGLPEQAECSTCHDANYQATETPIHSDEVYEAADCELCHNNDAWSPSIFVHLPEETTCNICHTANLDTANLNIGGHLGFGENCIDCHQSTQWQEILFDHSTTGFLLVDSHDGPLCGDCHGVEDTPTLCQGCHLDDYDLTETPVHSVQTFLSADCENCHTAVNWTDIIFEHGLPEQAECSTCHDANYQATESPIHSDEVYEAGDCELCHNNDAWSPSIFVHLPEETTCNICHTANLDTANVNIGGHLGFGENCIDCHQSTQWQEILFDHSTTGFLLTDSHDGPLCGDCHGVEDTPTLCQGCHLDEYDLAENPDHSVQTFLPADCEDCHTAVNWTDIIFEHGLPEQAECSTCHDANYQATESPIHSDEVYEAGDCELCHNNDAWSPSIFVHLPEETTCNICHTANLDTANVNIGGHLGFGENCIDCHQSTQWQEILFDHSITGFSLVDSHDGPLCGDCHGVEDTPTFCQGCHLDEYDLAENPDHSVQTFLSADCENCHTAVNWTDIIFEHGLPEQAECSTCHDANYQATESPIHSDEVYEAGDCELCHNNDAWSPSIFVHLPEETTCNICHTANLDTANVNIGGHLGFGENCIDCHQSTQWQEIIFDHSTTDFPLIDSHDGPLCGDCHDVGVPPTVCESCHFEEFVATENPDHQTQIFLSSDCEFCHSAVNWLDIIYDHGLPEQAACSTCHDADLQIANTNVTDHLGFPSDCTVCHLATNWTEITFDHSQTEFPLDGAHQSSECSNCHVEGYVDLPTDCGYCHLDEYNQTQNPNHLTAIYPLAECESCHNAEAWAPDIYSHLPDVESCNICHLADLIDANTTILGHSELPNNCTLCHATELWDDLSPFDHSLTAFELEGSHLEVDCLICHDSGFSLTATECYVCHTAEYDNTTEPIHITQIYPADDCEYCHSAVDWLPEIFDHLMPVSTSCSVCHLTEWDGANLTVPNHESYGDLCEICHTPDNWEAEVDHSFENTGFELEGLHLAVSCNGCHPNGLGNNGEVRDCASSDCHITDYDNSNENHHYNVPSGGFPSNYCELCHNAVNENFSPSIFIHELNNDDCNFCHQFDYDNAIQPNHSPIGYVDDCSTCHETVAWQGVDPHAISGTDCSDCHNYSGNYNDPVPNIDHNSAPKLGNSIDNCEICHTSTNSWSSLNFGASRHDGSIYQIYFDIYSNDHQGEWDNSCTNNCHVNGDFDSYSCYEGCHEHSQTGMLNEHCEDGPCANCSGSNGYWNIGFINYTNGSWTNPATFVQCYGCHPDGDKDGPCGDD